jgi:hypothetical protein
MVGDHVHSRRARPPGTIVSKHLFSDYRGPLFRDERQLVCGGPEELSVLADLRAWFAGALTRDLDEALRRLNALREFRNLPKDLAASMPAYRMKTVIDVLRERTGVS